MALAALRGEAVHAINRLPKGETWLTDRQLGVLLDQLLRTRSVAMDTDSGRRVRVVCRYQQYRGARKIID